MQDPTGSIGAGVQQCVMEREKHLTVGAVLFLKEVSNLPAVIAGLAGMFSVLKAV